MSPSPSKEKNGRNYVGSALYKERLSLFSFFCWGSTPGVDFSSCLLNAQSDLAIVLYLAFALWFALNQYLGVLLLSQFARARPAFGHLLKFLAFVFLNSFRASLTEASSGNLAIWPKSFCLFTVSDHGFWLVVLYSSSCFIFPRYVMLSIIIRLVLL